LGAGEKKRVSLWGRGGRRPPNEKKKGGTATADTFKQKRRNRREKKERGKNAGRLGGKRKVKALVTI